MKQSYNVECYKIVREDLTSLNRVSPFDTSYDDLCVIQYSKDHWAKPKIKNSKLFCFVDEDQAKNIYGLEGGHKYNLQLWKVLAYRPTKIHKVSSVNSAEYFIKFWENPKAAPRYGHPYRETFGSTRIKLLERII